MLKNRFKKKGKHQQNIHPQCAIQMNIDFFGRQQLHFTIDAAVKYTHCLLHFTSGLFVSRAARTVAVLTHTFTFTAVTLVELGTTLFVWIITSGDDFSTK